MKILLPVDGSDCAMRAIEYLIEFASSLKDVPEIHLLHVHSPVSTARIQAHVGPEALQAYYLEESHETIGEAQQRLDQAGLFHTTHIRVGQPAELITDLALELHVNLILMGTHGRSAIAGLVMGSVANRVLYLATCPVLLVK